MTEAYLLLGGNLGDRNENLAKARDQIAEIVQIENTSHVYETEPWGNTDQPAFYNQVLAVSTEIPAAELLEALIEIEMRIGRVRNERWEPRLIDIDLLFYGDLIVDSPSLTVPHALVTKRNFVLVPMLEIAPYLVHPIEKKTIEELYLDCQDELEVIYLEDGL